MEFRDIIIHGSPSIECGIFLDGTNDVTFEDVAIYDVLRTINDNNVRQGAKLNVNKCDFRGITQFGNKYSEVVFSKTAFNIGSGVTANLQGILYPGCDASFEECIFRANYQIYIPEDVTLTFDNCRCGPPALEQPLTNETILQYLHPDSKGNFVIL